MYTALQSTSVTISQFLDTVLARDLPAYFGSSPSIAMDISLDNPQEMDGSGISLWLYRLVRDEQVLNAARIRISPDMELFNPLPLRLHYLITPVVGTDLVRSAETKQTLLGKVLQTFHDTPRLHGIQLREDFQGTNLELTIRLETLSLEEIARIWESLDQPYQLSVSYEVSVVPVASLKQPSSVRPVQVVLPEYAIIID